MNTKIVMTSTSIMLGISGLILSFAPEILAEQVSIWPSDTTLLVAQVLGGIYFAFAMLNWMTRKARIGGIYNRPILVANFSHFTVSGLVFLNA